MFIAASEVAIILELAINQFKLTPAGYCSILAGVHDKKWAIEQFLASPARIPDGKIAIERDLYDPEGVG